MSSNNKVIIALFILFILIVLFSSFQTVVSTQKADTKAKTLLQNVPLPTPTPTSVVTTPVPPPPLPVQHPGFRVNVGGEGGDD